MADFGYVDTQEKLNTVCSELQGISTLAIDIECENNLHYYGAYITLIQISTGKKHWLIDVLVLDNIDCLLEVFKDSSIQKIFHDVSFDLRMLDYQFNCTVKNLFDTQLASLYCGEENVGLGSLLEKYVNVHKEKKFQMADWTKRPISKEMQSYAIVDTLYLIKLRDILLAKLEKLKRILWIEEEMKLLEDKSWEYSEGDWTSVKGYRDLSDSDRGILYELFMLREALAKKVDRPVHFVMNARKLIALSVKPPMSVFEWRKMKGVHPIIHHEAQKCFDAVKKGKEKPIVLKNHKRLRYTTAQREHAEQLNTLQSKLATKLGIHGYLIMNKDQIKEIVLSSGDLSCLHKWQKELVEE
jgi:ribonuclease D